MNRSALPWLVACAACALAGWQSGVNGPLPSAWAEEPDATAGMLCRTFHATHDVDGPAVDTTDQTSALGQWVAFERVHGWRVHSVDFEIAPKPNGYPQGLVQVCLER